MALTQCSNSASNTTSRTDEKTLKENTSDKWEYLYNSIEGFTYEPGYKYILKVKIEEIENPPIDGSSLKYTLLKQISKTKE